MNVYLDTLVKVYVASAHTRCRETKRDKPETVKQSFLKVITMEGVFQMLHFRKSQKKKNICARVTKN